ncbi:MAG: HAMP domain-containing sensor histidine kinase [Desulfarculaceae bacterium]|jgi:two-component system sensor histidine kinase CpxA
MRISRIYLKIFWSFIGVLVLTETLIFGLFIVSTGSQIKDRYKQSAAAQVFLLRDFLEQSIQSRPQTPLQDNEWVHKVLARIKRIPGAKLWLASEQGRIILKSFPEEAPPEVNLGNKKAVTGITGAKLYYGFGPGWNFYAQTQVALGPGKMGDLHMLLETKWHLDPDVAFPLGLATVGLLIAILVVPVSRLITKPITELRRSALVIANGDLSHRARIKGKDEIRELGRALNHLAKRVETMIRGGRELLANVSHELRSPLTRIRILEEFAHKDLGEKKTEELVQYLQEIREEVEQMDDLIGRILQFSKLDLSTSPWEPELADLRQVIDKQVARWQPLFKDRNLEFELKAPAQAMAFFIPRGMEAVLSNLMDNAAKYTAAGGKINLTLRESAEELSLELRNSSDIIDEQELAHIFEPFRRPRGQKEPGAGLGLALAKKIIEKHQGRISVSSTEEGFLVRVEIPK